VLNFIKRKALRFANFEAMQRVVDTNSKGIGKKQRLSKNIGLLLLRLFVLFILVLILSDVVIWYDAVASTRSYVVAIDDSGSMLANDYYPTRLSAAKSAADTFIDSINSQSTISVIEFAGFPQLLQEPTTDYSTAKNAISMINVSSSQGTDVASTIILSSYLLSEKGTNGDIILLTDGQANVGPSIKEAVKIAQENDVPVYTIGIGTIKGGKFMNGGLSTLDESFLKKIANLTGGKYFRSNNATDIKKAFRSIDKYSKQKLSIDLSPYLLFLALVLVFVEWGLINTKYRTLP